VQAMKRRSFIWKAGAALSGALASAAARASTPPAQLPDPGGSLEDIDAIRTLHHSFGRSLNERGHADTCGRRFTGLLSDPTRADVVELAPDRQSARARFHCLMRGESTLEAASSILEMARLQGQGTRQWWEAGVFENAYVNDGGVWKIQRLAYRAMSEAPSPEHLISRC
jgi:hypothetical protein